MPSSYLEFTAHLMSHIRVNPDKHNAIFLSKGRYTVRHIELEDSSFDSMIEGLLNFNKSADHTRCIMVKSPNSILRSLASCRPICNKFMGPMPLVKSMLTYCAPMENAKIETVNFKAVGRLDEAYLVPDRRQLAAEMVNDNNDLVELAKTSMNLASVTVGGAVAFEGAPLYEVRR